MRTKPADLSDAFDEMISQLMEAGFTTPLHWAAIGRNGAMMGGCYERIDDRHLECQIVFTNGADLVVPINLLFVDGRGEPARGVVGPTGPEIVKKDHVS